jgi:hypothetical protein
MGLALGNESMRTTSLISSLCSPLLVCGGSSSVGSGSELTVSITFDVAPQIVKVRQGVSGPWETATQLTTTTFEIRVTQAYTVMTVCVDGNDSAVALRSRTPEMDLSSRSNAATVAMAAEARATAAMAAAAVVGTRAAAGGEWPAAGARSTAPPIRAGFRGAALLPATAR